MRYNCLAATVLGARRASTSMLAKVELVLLRLRGSFIQLVSFFHSRLQIMLLLLAKLAILATSILPFCVYSLTVTAAQCIDPVVRKEWRKLSVSEKADWISAVNVSEADILYVT